MNSEEIKNHFGYYNYNTLLNYANKHKIIYYLKNYKTIIFNINIFAVISGFEIDIEIEPEIYKTIERETNGDFVLKQIIAQDRKTLNCKFEPFFDFIGTFNYKEFQIIFKLIDEYKDNVIVANIISDDTNDIEPLVIQKKYFNEDVSNVYNQDSLMVDCYIAITFNGKPIKLPN